MKEGICSIPGCGKPLKCKGLCSMHYYRQQRNGNPLIKSKTIGGTCIAEGCERPIHDRKLKLCSKHIRRYHKTGSWKKEDMKKAPPGALKSTICKVPGCTNTVSSTKHMLCNKHWIRFKQHGTTSDSVLVNRRSLTLRDRLIRGMKVNEATGCWEWQRGLFSTGYGQISINKRGKGAHVVSYEVFNGEIPVGMEVCHTCDNPICINPDHLFLGTHQDNMTDMVNKGRSAVANNVHAKMTEKQVSTLLSMYSTGKYTIKELAEYFPITKGVIKAIIDGRSWKHMQPKHL